jgi:hypothetical protein
MGEWRFSSTILTSALDGGEWSASRSCRFTPSTNWIGGWVGPRAGLDATEKNKISCPCRETNPSRPARSLVAIPTELSRMPGSNLDCGFFVVFLSPFRQMHGWHLKVGHNRFLPHHFRNIINRRSYCQRR